MPKAYNSVFHEEIEIHMELRKEELGNEAYRHYKRTVKLFDDYLYQIGLKKKEISEFIVEEWIKEVSYYQSFYNKLIFHFSSKIKEVLA